MFADLFGSTAFGEAVDSPTGRSSRPTPSTPRNRASSQLREFYTALMEDRDLEAMLAMLREKFVVDFLMVGEFERRAAAP
jgi:hypothetical protein